MILSKRLSSLASLVPDGASLADIGSDHGLLPLFLLKQGKVKRVFAVENKQGPFSRLSRAIGSSVYASRCELSLSDGISSLPPWVDTVVLAGMGGDLIERILMDGKERLKNVSFILTDAHGGAPSLRKCLSSLGYEAKKDIYLIDDGLPYELYLYGKSPKPISYSEEELIFGPLEIKIKSQGWQEYWRYYLNKKTEIIDNPSIPDKEKDKYRVEIERIKKAIS